MSNTLLNVATQIRLPSHYAARAKSLLNSILNYANEKEGYKFWAAVSTLASHSGYSRRHTHNLLCQFRQDGIIEPLTKKCHGTKSKPIVYRVVLEKLMEFGMPKSLGVQSIAHKPKTPLSLNEATEEIQIRKQLDEMKFQKSHLDLKHSWLRFKQLYKNPRTLQQWGSEISSWFGRELKRAREASGNLQIIDPLRPARPGELWPEYLARLKTERRSL